MEAWRSHLFALLGHCQCGHWPLSCVSGGSFDLGVVVFLFMLGLLFPGGGQPMFAAEPEVILSPRASSFSSDIHAQGVPRLCPHLGWFPRRIFKVFLPWSTAPLSPCFKHTQALTVMRFPIPSPIFFYFYF